MNAGIIARRRFEAFVDKKLNEWDANYQGEWAFYTWLLNQAQFFNFHGSVNITNPQYKQDYEAAVAKAKEEAVKTVFNAL